MGSSKPTWLRSLWLQNETASIRCSETILRYGLHEICIESRKRGQTMISYQTILQQLEKQLDEAKKATGEQQIRESLTAVRALCDVVLAQSVEVSKTQPKHIPQMLTQGPTQQVHYTAKMEEEDGANGDSLFDF